MEIDRGHPLTDLFTDLRHERSATWIALDGLSEAESEELLRDRAGRPIAAPLVQALHRETDGNPFFLEEMLRHLEETNAAALHQLERGATLDRADLDLPDTIRNLVVRRVRRLPEPVIGALSAAAVVGVEFDVALVALLLRRPTAEILDDLDQATTAGLVVEDTNTIGRYLFSHALVRQALYSELTTSDGRSCTTTSAW